MSIKNQPEKLDEIHIDFDDNDSEDIGIDDYFNLYKDVDVDDLIIIRCENCGVELIATSDYCYSCGTQIKAENKKDSKDIQTTKSEKVYYDINNDSASQSKKTKFKMKLVSAVSLAIFAYIIILLTIILLNTSKEIVNGEEASKLQIEDRADDYPIKLSKKSAIDLSNKKNEEVLNESIYQKEEIGINDSEKLEEDKTSGNELVPNNIKASDEGQEKVSEINKLQTSEKKTPVNKKTNQTKKPSKSNEKKPTSLSQTNQAAKVDKDLDNKGTDNKLSTEEKKDKVDEDNKPSSFDITKATWKGKARLVSVSNFNTINGLEPTTLKFFEKIKNSVGSSSSCTCKINKSSGKFDLTNVFSIDFDTYTYDGDKIVAEKTYINHELGVIVTHKLDGKFIKDEDDKTYQFEGIVSKKINSAEFRYSFSLTN